MKVNVKFISPLSLTVKKTDIKFEIQNSRITLKELFEKNAIVCGLSKSSSILTQKGDSLVAKLNRLSPFKTWYYYPVAESKIEDHQSDIYFIKLNGNSFIEFCIPCVRHRHKQCCKLFCYLPEVLLPFIHGSLPGITHAGIVCAPGPFSLCPGP